jgi:hypothetical protein
MKVGDRGRSCSTHGEIRNDYRVLVEKPEGKRPLTLLTHRCEDNIKMKITAFWDIAPCSLVEVDRRYSRGYCLIHSSP